RGTGHVPLTQEISITREFKNAADRFFQRLQVTDHWCDPVASGRSEAGGSRPDHFYELILLSEVIYESRCGDAPYHRLAIELSHRDLGKKQLVSVFASRSGDCLRDLVTMQQQRVQ